MHLSHGKTNRWSRCTSFLMARDMIFRKWASRIMQSQLRRLSEAEREVARTTFFACIAGTGLDAAVNRLTLRQPRWLRSHGGYVVGLLRVLGGFQPPHITLSVEVDGHWQTRIDEPGFLIAAGNGPRYGHGMRLTHRAQMDDGLLDLCFVRPLSKLRLCICFAWFIAAATSA